MPNRVSLTPSLRFEILRRDHFTCTYCGAAAPDVRLVVDHKRPVARGGSNHAYNLATACEPCNQGKGASPEYPDSEDEWVRAMILNTFASRYLNPVALVATVRKVREERPAPRIDAEYSEPHGYAAAMAEWEWDTLSIGVHRMVARILRIIDDPEWDPGEEA